MNYDSRIQKIQQVLVPWRERLLEHPIYGEINSLDKLRLFMRYHVFAVWDFMSLLKRLQGELCGVGLPWLPPADPVAARLVNEIVLGEESDEDVAGGFASHFELYRRAMREAGASTGEVDRFLALSREGLAVSAALEKAGAPEGVRRFVGSTFRVIDGGELVETASAFTFGREDLLPDVFQRIVDRLHEESGGGLETFRYYLHRHIELDGDHHGPLAARLVGSLCGESETNWRLAERSAIESLRSRLELWDAMHRSMLALPLEAAD
jgi:hypothetical protein